MELESGNQRHCVVYVLRGLPSWAHTRWTLSRKLPPEELLILGDLSPCMLRTRAMVWGQYLQGWANGLKFPRETVIWPGVLILGRASGWRIGHCILFPGQAVEVSVSYRLCSINTLPCEPCVPVDVVWSQRFHS